MKKAIVQYLKQQQFYHEHIELNDNELQQISDLQERLLLAASYGLCSYDRIIEKLTTIQQRILADTEARETQRNNILTAIDMMDDQTQAKIIRLRYIENWLWKEIQAELHYTESVIMKKHNAALITVYKHLSAAGFI